MKLKGKPFHQLWCRYAKEGKTKEDLRQALGLTDVHPLNTRRARLAAKGYKFPELPCNKPKDTPLDELIANDRVRALKAQVKAAQQEQLDAHYVKQHILQLSTACKTATPPDWLTKPATSTKGLPSIPTLFISDWRWGEVETPSRSAA